MEELTGKIIDLSRDFKTGKARITFEVNEYGTVTRMFDKYKNSEKLTVAVKEYREKRSLDANAYAWVLIDKLSAKLNRAKEEVYKDFIRDVGGNNVIICCKSEAVADLVSLWSKRGIGWVAETMPSKINGCENIILYYGSSIYDRSQMSRLTSLIVEECKTQGIQTETPNQIAIRLSLWEGK